ncbi:hypothetical protein Tco_0120715 [Tanacetum coccineum]
MIIIESVDMILIMTEAYRNQVMRLTELEMDKNCLIWLETWSGGQVEKSGGQGSGMVVKGGDKVLYLGCKVVHHGGVKCSFELKNLDVSLRSRLRERYLQSDPLHMDVLNSSVVVYTDHWRQYFTPYNGRLDYFICVRNFGRGWRKFELRNLPEGLDFEEFGALHDGISLQNLDQFCHVSYEQDDRRFVSQAWNRLFRIKEQLGWEKRRAGPPTITPPNMLSTSPPMLTMTPDTHHPIPRSEIPSAVWCIICSHCLSQVVIMVLMTLGSLMNVTLGPETSSMSVAKLVDLGICTYNGLGIGEMLTEIPEVVGDDDVGVGLDWLGGWQTEQERFILWNIDHLSQLLAYYRIDHTRYDGTHYFYVPSIPDLGVNQGVNFMSGTPGYSTAPSPSPFTSQLGMFGDAHPFTSRNQDDMNED